MTCRAEKESVTGVGDGYQVLKIKKKLKGPCFQGPASRNGEGEEGREGRAAALRCSVPRHVPAAACGGQRPRAAPLSASPSRSGSRSAGGKLRPQHRPGSKQEAGKCSQGAPASPCPRKPQGKLQRTESGVPRYHASPYGRSGSAQQRLAPEHAVDEPADDAQRAEGHLQQPQQHHVALVEDEVPVAIHAAPAGRSPAAGPALSTAGMGAAQQTRTHSASVECFNICIASVAQLKRSLKVTYYKCFSSLFVVVLCFVFCFFPQKRFFFFLLPCTYTQTHYKNLIHNIKGRAIVSHVNIFLRVIHF